MYVFHNQKHSPLNPGPLLEAKVTVPQVVDKRTFMYMQLASKYESVLLNQEQELCGEDIIKIIGHEPVPKFAPGISLCRV